MLVSSVGLLARSRSNLFNSAIKYRSCSTQIQQSSEVKTEQPQEKSFHTFRYRPFLDFYEKLPHERLAYSFTETAQEVLKPQLLRNGQLQIVGCHQQKATAFSEYMYNFYTQTDPKHYWMYGIPEALKEMKKLSGPISTYTLFFGYWLFLISKGIITTMDVKFHGIHCLVPIWGAYHFLYDPIVNYYAKHHAKLKKRTQELMDEPAAVYKDKIDYLTSEIDFNYVKLMLADMDNELMKIRKEIQYREFLKMKHDEFKKRINYQVEMTMLENNFESNLLRSWVLPQVDDAITPELKKTVLQECLGVLQAKAAAARPATA